MSDSKTSQEAKARTVTSKSDAEHMADAKNEIRGRAQLLNAAEGVDNSDDLRVQGYDEAHKTLSSMCQSFDFSLCNLAVLNASSDDLIMAYVKWGTVEADEVSKSTPGGVPLVNVSKALRRITALMEFVQEHSDSIAMSVDDLPKFEKMYRELGFVMSAHARDPKGRVMAFYNLKKIAQDEFHAHSDDEIMAFLYYLTLRMSLNQTMQERHVVIVQDISGISLSGMRSLMPPDVHKKMGKLTQGASAVKMKQFHILGQSWWMSIFWMLMKWFLSSKMRSRFNMHGNDYDTVWQLAGGAQNVPVYMENGASGANNDLLWNDRDMWASGDDDDAQTDAKKRRRRKKQSTSAPTEDGEVGTPDEK